jgi:hypothetical protein
MLIPGVLRHHVIKEIAVRFCDPIESVKITFGIHRASKALYDGFLKILVERRDQIVKHEGGCIFFLTNVG